MIINLGEGAQLDLEKLIPSKLLLQANSGGGKSWLIRRLLEQTHGHIQQIVIDVEDEFYTLREKFDYILVRKEGGDAVPDIRSADVLAHRLLEMRVSAIISLQDMPHHERRQFVERFTEALTDSPKKLWHPLFYVVDEAHRFAEEKGGGGSRSKDDSCTNAIINFMSQSRKRGFCGVLATQRISKLNKDAAAECNNKLIGRAAIDIDRDRAAKELGIRDKDQILAMRTLNEGEFFAFGPAISNEVVRVQVGGVQTTHPRPGKMAAPITPPRKKVLAALAKIGDIPKEAEQKRATLESLQRDLAEAKNTIRSLSKHQERYLQVKPEPKKIKVGIVKESHISRLEKQIDSMTTHLKNANDLLAQLQRVVTDAKKLNASSTSAPAPNPGPGSRPKSPGLRFQSPHNVVVKPVIQRDGIGEAEIFKITPRHQSLLNALAFYRDTGQAVIDKRRHAAFLGRAFDSYFKKDLSELRSAHLIDYPQPGKVALTAQGEVIAQNDQLINRSEDLHEIWLNRLHDRHSTILRALLEMYPNSIGKPTIAEQLNRAFDSYFKKDLSEMRTLGIIDYPSPGMVVASPNLFI